MKRNSEALYEVAKNKRAKIEPEAADQLLLNAVSTGNVSKLEGLVQQGNNINVLYGPRGDTPAHFVVLHGKKDILRKLLDLGLDINTQNNQGANITQVALNSKQKVIDKFLITEKGSSLNSSFHYAVKFGNVEMVHYLFELGASVHSTRQDDGAQPIHMRNIKMRVLT